MAVRKAYSYIRFSSAEQQKGDSLRRQRVARDEFIAKHNALQKKKEKAGEEPDYLELDDQILDLGLSGYKGEHIADGGALGAFLERIRQKQIAAGSILIVEHLDRLGRMEVVDQLEIFLGIIRQGVEIVTLIDGKWYSRASVRSDQTALIISIITMTQSYNESHKKAERLAAAWVGKREEINQGKAVTSVCPGWIKLNQTGAYELIPERANLVKEIFARTLKGDGKRTIARDFNVRAIKPWGVGGKMADGWHDSYIQKILHNDAVIGRFQPHTTRQQPGRRVPVGKPVENYYPAAIDKETWQAAQTLRKGTPGRRAVTVKNLFIGLLKDGVHGCTMNFVDKGGSQISRWQYLISDRQRTHPKEEIKRWKYKDFETLFLRAMLDYDWHQNRGTDPDVARLESSVSILEKRQAELKLQGKNIAKAIAGGEDVAFVREEMRDIEKQLLDVEREFKKTNAELQARKDAQLVLRPLDHPEEIFKNRDTEEVRSQLRLEIRQRFTRIDLFPDGTAEAKEQPDLPEPWDLQCQIQRGFKATLVNGAQIWVFSALEQIGVIELLPPGHKFAFWRSIRKELHGWKYIRAMTNEDVNQLCQKKTAKQNKR